jgi:hypothetical protein
MPILIQESTDSLSGRNKSKNYSETKMPEKENLAYSLTKSSAGMYLKSLQDEVIHVYEPLDGNVLVIEGGKFVIHTPCNAQLVQVNAQSIEFRDSVTATQVGIKAQTSAFYANLTAELLQADIEDEFYLDDAAVVRIDVLDLQAIAANCLGTLKVAKVARVDVNQIEFGGQAEWEGITALNVDRLICYDGSHFSVAHTHPDYPSVLNVDQHVVIQEHSTLSLSGKGKRHVVLKTKELTQLGNLKCHTAIVDSDKIRVEANAKLSATLSELHGAEAVINGETSMQESLFNVDDFLQSKNASARCCDSVVQSRSYLKVDGKLDATKTNFISKNVVLRAETQFVEANIQADTIKIQTGQMNSSGGQFIGNQILLDAMQGKQQHDKLTLQADSLETRGTVGIQNSQLNIIGQGVFTNSGNLHLTDTIVNGAGQISNANQASLQISCSTVATPEVAKSFEPDISVSYISNQGNISISKARIAVKNISHTGQSFILDNAMCYVERGLIVDDNAQLKLINQSKLLGCQDAIVAVKSKIEIKSGSKVEAKSLYTLPQAEIEISDAQLSIERVGLLGKSKITNAPLRSRSTTVVGQLTTDETLLLADEFGAHGVWLSKKTQLITKESVLLGDQAQITSIDSIIKTKQLEIQSKIKTEGSAQWQALTLTTQSESAVEGSALKVDASIWNHSGSIKLKKELQAKGAQLLNAGEISVVGSANLGFNAVVNAGSMSSTNLNLNTASYLNAGRVSGHNVKINSLVNVNFGLTQAFNLQLNSLHHSNLGLYIPDLSYPGEWFTFSSMQSAGKIIATNLLPDYSSYIQFMFSAPAFVRTLKAAWKARGDLTYDKISQYYLHEYVEHVLNVTQFLSSGKQVYDQSSAIYADAPNHWKSLTREAVLKHWKSLNWDSIKESIPFADIAKAVPMAAVKAIAPKTTTQFLADVNAGVMISANFNESSYNSSNTGARYAFDSYSVDGDQIIDSGHTYSFLGGITYKGKNIITQGNLHSQNDRVNLQAPVVTITASAEHKEHQAYTIKSEKLQITGAHTFSRSIIKTRHTQFGDESNEEKQQATFTEDSVITTATAEFNQDIHLSKSTMHIDEATHETKIHLSDQAHLDVKGNHHVIGKGVVVAEEKSRLTNEAFILKDHAQVDLKSDSVLNSKKLQVEDNSFYHSDKSATSANSVQTHGKGHIKVENESVVKSDEVKSSGRYESLFSATLTDTVDVLAGGTFQLQNGSGLRSKTITTDGNFDATQSRVEVEKIQVEEAGIFQLEASTLKAKEMKSDGKSSFTSMLAEIETKVSLSAQAQLTLADATLKTELLEDKSMLKVAGESILDVTHYDHQGRLQVQEGADADKAKLIVKAKTADLQGSSDLTNATFAVDNLQNASAFAMGQGAYNQYGVSKSLKVKTEAAMHLSGPYQRQGDLSAEAKAIVVDANFKGDINLHLKATDGGLAVHKSIEVKNFHGEAKYDIFTGAMVSAQKNIILHSEEGKFENKDALTGENTAVQAKSITNSGGGIFGRDKVLLHATDGDIVNQAGTIRGSNYTQLQANGNVINTCNEKLVQDTHDKRKEYSAGVLAGGAGIAESNGVGLNIIATGKVVNHGSLIVSDGHNAINAGQGVEFTAPTHTYITKDEERTSGFLGCNHSHTLATSTQVQQAQMFSKNGKNTIYSAHGGLNSTGGQFISAQGTQADVEKDINLLSVKTRDREVTEKSGWWGLSKEKRDEFKESSRPTVVADQENTVMRARDGNVNAIGTLFLGTDGDLTLIGNDITLEQDVNNTEAHVEVQSIGLSVFGVSAFESAKAGGSFGDVVSELDPTARSINNLVNSESVVGNLAGAANLGVEAFNSAGSIASAFNKDSLGGAVLQRYGLGDANGFKPSANLSFSQTTTDIKTQTPGSGGAYKRNVTLNAKNAINIKGYDVNASGDASLEAKEINLVSLALESSSESHTEKVSVGLTATGDVTNVGLGLSQSSSHATQHLHANLNVQGNLHLKADKMKMSGANIDTNSVSGHVNMLEMESVQDEMSSQSKSIDVNTSGMVSVQASSHDSKEVRLVTGIHVKTALNTSEKAFTVGNLKQKGASVTSDVGVNDFAESTSTESIHDYSKTQGIGYSVNPLKIAESDNGHQQRIPTVSLNVTFQDKQTLVHSTGEREVLADTNIKFKANIPILDPESVHRTLDQIKEAGDKLFSSSSLPAADSNDSKYVLGDFNLKNELHKPWELLPATHVEPKATHRIAQPEHKELKEHKEHKVPKEVTAQPSASPSQYGLDPAVVIAIERMANCGMLPVNYVSLVEALALSATGVGAVPAALMAAYTMDEFWVNWAACMEGVKHDSYLTQLMQATMPKLEREFSMMKEAYNLMHPQSGFFTASKQSLDVLLASKKHRTQMPAVSDHKPHQSDAIIPHAANNVATVTPNHPKAANDKQQHASDTVHHHKPNTPVVGEPKHPVAKSSAEASSDSKSPTGKVIIKPKIIKPLSTESKGKVIIKPVIVKPLPTHQHKHPQKSKKKEIIQPLPLMPLAPPKAKNNSNQHGPLLSHNKPENALLVIPQPSSEGQSNFFKTVSPEMLREHEKKSQSRFDLGLEHFKQEDVESAIKENPGRYGLFKPAEFKLPPVEPINPDNALALTAKYRVLRNARFLQEKEFPFPGALPDNLASTFAGHRYRTYLLTEPALLPRAGTQPNALGRFFSFEPPRSEIQVRMDKAILPVWPKGDPSPVDTTHWVQFPAGTTIHVGQIAGQGNGFWGHTEQIVIENPWTIPGAKHLYSLPLKKEKEYQKYKRP